jgi:hypothetical protein
VKALKEVYEIQGEGKYISPEDGESLIDKIGSIIKEMDIKY